MSRCRNLFIGLLLLCAAGADADTFVQQPSRAFGYVIGDVLEQRIALQSNGNPVELAEIPAVQRAGQWLERLSSTLTNSDSGQHWLDLKYQVINAPSELTTISLPALSLAVINGEPLIVDEWPIIISPIVPAVVAGSSELPPMQPDRAPVLADTSVATRRLNYTVIALFVTILAWSGWWYWRHNTDARRLPFSRAFRDMRKLGFKQLDDNPQAWFALHHAFNGSAGRTINSGTIAELIQQQPWLKSLQSRIEAFYAASAARFFEQATEPQSFALFEFGKALYLAEKRHSTGHRPQARG